MTHKMRLVGFAFEAIKNGTKDIEVRLNDEKRRLINVGDTIIFTNLDTSEELNVSVVNLYRYDNFNIAVEYFDNKITFKELFDAFPHKRLGLKDNDSESIMNSFYTLEEEKEYGVLGIEIKLI